MRSHVDVKMSQQSSIESQAQIKCRQVKKKLFNMLFSGCIRAVPHAPFALGIKMGVTPITSQ